VPRPLPELTPEVAFFWASGADGVLRMLRCGECGYWIHPPGPVCPICLSDDVHPQPLSGRAIVTTYTVNRQQWRPDLEVPYVVAIVDLAEQEGLRLTTNIVGCAVDDVRIGMPVEVVFQQVEDVWLPLFTPVGSA
jgi:uncharacterized protein